MIRMNELSRVTKHPVGRNGKSYYRRMVFGGVMWYFLRSFLFGTFVFGREVFVYHHSTRVAR